jgi:hypothetical protein
MAAKHQLTYPAIIIIIIIIGEVAGLETQTNLYNEVITHENSH